MLLAIDYGHLFCDSGAVFEGLREDKLVQTIGDYVQDVLRSKGVNTIATTGTLQNRVDIANSSKVDYFISIHINSGGGTGNEVLINTKASQKSKDLASVILSAITESTKLYKRGVRVDKEYLGYNLKVLNDTKMPSCLIECGFIDVDWSTGRNTLELAKLYGVGIVEGILSYLEYDKCKYCGK